MAVIDGGSARGAIRSELMVTGSMRRASNGSAGSGKKAARSAANNLALAGRMQQRHEDLGLGLPVGTDGIADDA